MNLLEIVFEKLKTIFEAKFSNSFNNNRISLFNFSKNSTSLFEIRGGNRLSLDLTHANPEEKKQVKEKIIDYATQIEKEAFLVNPSLITIKKVKENLPDEAEQKLLEFYKDKLTPEMYTALEASIVVRNAFKRKEDIKELKQSIAKKHPSWGNNLCNMVSEGYFDDYFKNLYLNMFKDESFDIRAYQRNVESTVKSLPFTVFVTKYKSYEELSGEVRFKLSNLKKYGTGKLLIHGIGYENIITTQKLGEEYKSEVTDIKIDINQSKTIITSTLTF